MIELKIQGVAVSPIWVMEDGEAPATIGIRLDCGDAGVVYMTSEQASDLANDLLDIVRRQGDKMVAV